MIDYYKTSIEDVAQFEIKLTDHWEATSWTWWITLVVINICKELMERK